MKKINLFLCFGLIFALISCNQSRQQAEDNTIDFDTIKVENTHYYNNDTTMSSCDLKISFVYPSRLASDSALHKIQKEIISLYFEEDQYSEGTPDDAVSKYVANFTSTYDETISSYKSRPSDYGDDELFYMLSEELQGHILYNQNDILSFQVERRNSKMEDIVYTQLKNCVFDLETGKPIREEDMFLPDYEEDLHKLFIVQLLQMFKVKNLAELNNPERGYTNLEEITPNRNFYVDGEGITYVFNSGEYSSSKIPAIKIKLPYKDIKPLVRDNSPIERLLN